MTKIYNTKKGIVKVIKTLGKSITYLPPYFSGKDLANLRTQLKA